MEFHSKEVLQQKLVYFIRRTNKRKGHQALDVLVSSDVDLLSTFNIPCQGIIAITVKARENDDVAREHTVHVDVDQVCCEAMSVFQRQESAHVARLGISDGGQAALPF